MELYSADENGTRRAVFVEVGIDGDIQLGTQDLGAAPLAAFGQHEYEFAVSVAARDLFTLLTELLAEQPETTSRIRSEQSNSQLLIDLLAARYRDDPDAVDHFRDWLKAHQIKHTFWNRMGD